MSTISEILTPSRIFYKQDIDNKKRALEVLSLSLCKDLTDADSQQVLADLINRERLGSTGIGHGVAIPHIRQASAKRPIAAFLHLKQAINFDSEDGEDVDLIFALIVPQADPNTHLKLLAKLAKLFSDPKRRNKLRRCEDNLDCYKMMTQLEHEIN